LTLRERNFIHRKILYLSWVGAAIAFSTGFYQALGAGKSIPTAFNFGLSAIKGEVQKSKDIAVLL